MTAVERLSALRERLQKPLNDKLMSEKSYREALDNLFARVEALLRPAHVESERRMLEIEDLEGPTELPVLWARFAPGNVVKFVPMGRAESGTIGRVDMIGPREVHRLMYLQAEPALDRPTGEWRYIGQNPRQLLQLDDEALSSLIESTLLLG